MKIDCIVGMSLDARIDWIKSIQELQEIYYGIVMKSTYDAMICGSTTMLKAQYDENNTAKYSSQTLIVIDSEGKVSNWPIIKKQAWWNDNPIVLCSNNTPKTYLKTLEEHHIKYLITGRDKIDLSESVKILENKNNIKTLRIDSGGILLGKMIREKLVNRITTVIVPQLTGGNSSKSIFTADDLTNIDDVTVLKLLSIQQIKENYVVLEYEIQY